MLLRAITPVISMWCIGMLCGTSAAESVFLEPKGHPGIIVFVHGLTGDAEDTWTNEKTKAYWPQIVKKDGLFDGMDILVYDYPSAFVGDGFSIDGLADRFMTDMNDASIGIKNYERIIIVAHSLGGIITRKFILDDPDIRGKVKGIFLFATPMLGSSLSNVLSLVSNNPAVGQLVRPQNGDSFLADLSKDWRNANLSPTIHSFCAFEMNKTGFWFFATKVVERLSAEQLCSRALQEIGTNHSDIVRPASKRDHIHKILRQWYTEIFPDAERTAATDERNVPIVVASCDVDRYGPDLNDTISSELQSLGYAWRLTRRLPEDWKDSYRSYLWQKHEPKLLIIHLSCFQQGPGSETANVERTGDFIGLLQTLKDSDVKILVYSRAFTTDPNFVRNHIPSKLRAVYSANDRLMPLALKFGKPFRTDPEARKTFRSLINAALNGNAG